MSPQPPRWLRRILERTVPDGASGPSLLGDLIEEYAAVRSTRGRVRADVWYAGQVAAIALPYALLGGFRSFVGALAGLGRGLSLDLRHAYRGLRSNPLLTAVAVISLSLGIGLTTSVTSFVNGVWLAPLPYPHAERLVDLEDTHPDEVCAGCSVGASYASFSEWREELRVFEDVAAMSGGRRNVDIGGTPREIFVTAVTGNHADLMGVRTHLGRSVLPGDEDPAAEPILVLGHGLWTDVFGADPDVVGRTLRVDGVLHTVVGVASADTRALDHARAWVALPRPAVRGAYGDRSLWVVGRLAEGVSVETAAEALRRFSSERYASAGDLEPGWTATAKSLRAAVTRDAGPVMLGVALLLATTLVLLVACVNLAALMLARVTERERELGIRLAIGSSRGRLARTAILESLVLAMAGGVGGTLIARVATTAIAGQLQGRVPGWVQFGLDARVLAGVSVTVVLTALACGLLPLLRACSIAPGHGVIRGMDARRGPSRSTRHDWLLGAQIALGVVLVGGGVAAVQSLVRVADFDSLGHRYENITTVDLATGVGTHSSTDETYALVRELDERFLSHPSVGRSVATRTLFLGSWGSSDGPSPVWADGAAEAVPDRIVPRHSLAVGPGYFDLMEIPLVAGRAISAADTPGDEASAVVSRRAAAVLWPGSRPTEVLGRRFRVELDDVTQVFGVVGVSADVVGNPRSESRREMPMIYTALAQTHPSVFDNGFSSDLAFRLDVRGDAPSERAIEELIADVDPDMALARLSTVEGNLRLWIMPVILTAGLMSTLSALALGLLMLGIYGTLSYRIASSRREIGVRIAIGATARALVLAVTSQVGRVLAVSIAVGLAVSIPVARTVGNGEIPLGGADPAVLAVTALVLLSVAGVACLVPVRRALAIDPIESLRAD